MNSVIARIENTIAQIKKEAPFTNDFEPGNISVKNDRAMNRIKFFLSHLALCGSMLLSAQSFTMQFMQTEYDIKELFMIDGEVGYAVGESHWDQEQKDFRSTVLKTIDGGTGWSSLPVPYSGDLWDIHFFDQDQGWVAGEAGLLLSTKDGGFSWTKKDVGTSLDFNSLSFTDADHGWVLANEVLNTNPFGDPDAWKGRIWFSSDGGESWSEQDLPADAGLIHCVYFKNSMEGWAIGVKNKSIDFFAETKCAAYYTSDGGVTWIEKYSPDLDFVFTDIVFPDDKHGYMVGFKSNSGETDGSIFRTIDGGNSWERSTAGDVLWEVDFIDSLRGYVLGTMYGAAWGPPVYRTMDGGDTWENIKMEEHAGQGLYGLKVFEDKVLGLGDDGYKVWSTDPWGDYGDRYGEQLFSQEMIDTLYQFEDIFFINNMQGWVVGQKSRSPAQWAQVILHTSDGGENWEEQYDFHCDISYSTGFRLNAVQFVNESMGWAVGASSYLGDTETSGVLFTSDGGENWTQQAHEISEGQIVDLCFLDGQNGWALSDITPYPEFHIQLMKTSDGGENWEMVSTGQTGYITIGFGIRTGAVHFQDAQTGWILGAQCDLLKTEDGGASWFKVSLPQEWTNTFDIGFAGEQKASICGETNFVSNNGGLSWSESPEQEHTCTDLCFIDATLGWMVGAWGSILYTLDGGASWEVVEHQATEAAFKAVSFPSLTAGWAAGRGGTIVHIDPSTLSKDFQYHQTSSLSKLLANHPNPLHGHTEIGYELSEPGDVNLSIYDLNGRKICTLVEDYRARGSHSTIWKAQDSFGQKVNPGIYIYRLQTKTGSESRTMVVL